MDIIIDDNYKLSTIQEEFRKHYPFLKLEFFEYSPKGKKVFLKKNIIWDTNQTIGEVRHVHHLGHVSINGHQKVSTLENNFHTNYGLNVQVFRKADRVWLETVSTDDWTLAKQNKVGKENSTSIAEELERDYEQYFEQL
jgi:hypothetical protein